MLTGSVPNRLQPSFFARIRAPNSRSQHAIPSAAITPVSSTSLLSTLPSNWAPFLRRHYPASSVPRASRHPKQPGLALAGCQLVRTAHHRLGLPVLRRSPLYMHAVATTPVEPLGARFARFLSSGGLPRNSGVSASTLPFSRPAQSSLLVRPACSPSHYNDPLHQRLRLLRYLHSRSDCYRLER